MKDAIKLGHQLEEEEDDDDEGGMKTEGDNSIAMVNGHN